MKEEKYDKLNVKSPLAKVGRDNHLEHIVNVLPIITVVFGIQCYIMSRITPAGEFGDFPLYLAATLIAFISGLFYYDKNHHVIFYQDHMHISFSLFGTNKIIYYKDIREIHGPEEECKFSSLLIKTREQGNLILHFVDYPLTVKSLILEQKAKNIINIYQEMQSVQAKTEQEELSTKTFDHHDDQDKAA